MPILLYLSDESKKGELFVVSQRRWNWSFVGWLFVLGCIVGFVNYTPELLKTCANIDLEPQERINITLFKDDNHSPKKELVAVAIKDEVIKRHPLYFEVDGLDREIIAREAEEFAYKELIQTWESKGVLANTNDFLAKQSLIVSDTLNKSSEEVIERLRQKMVAEKETANRESQKELSREKSRIRQAYAKKIESEEKVFRSQTEEINQRRNTLLNQSKYSIRVDIGLTGKSSADAVSTKELQVDSKDNYEKDLAEKRQEWEQRLTQLTENQAQDLRELEKKEQAKLTTKLQEIEQRYLVEEKNIKIAVANEKENIEKRRSDLAVTLQEIGVNTYNRQAEAVLASFKEKQTRQLINAKNRRANLLKRIEKELADGLRLLARENNCTSSILISREEATGDNTLDLTNELIDFVVK